MRGSETKTLSFFQLQRCRPIAYLGLTARPRTLNITFLKLYMYGTHRPQWDHRVDPGIRRKETKSLGVPPTLINIKSLRRLPNRTRDLSSSLRCDPCDSSESEQLKMHDHSGYNEIYRCPHLKTPKTRVLLLGTIHRSRQQLICSHHLLSIDQFNLRQRCL